MPPAAPLTVHVVTHTHWDREWYLPAGRFRQRLVALIDDVLARCPAPGESFLLDGQAIVIEDYLAVRPERRDALAARLRDGSMEAGPWYVLADELIPSGEALVRNLLVGRAVLRGLGAEPPPVLYSPDAFGHPAALPMLARQFGYPLIVLWRGLGGEGWPDGDTFRWCAPDESCALVHHLPRAGYEYGSNLPATEHAMREWWRAARDELGARSRLGVLLVLNGADHHAVQPDLDRALATLSRVAAPDVIVHGSLGGAAREIVRRAEACMAETRDVIPEIDGELRRSYGYTWTLQGTFATRSALKRRNAATERLLLRDAEPWAALATLHTGRSRQHLARAAWKSLLLCHPHDTLCGCSTDEVARTTSARLDDAEAQARGLRDDAVLDLIGHDAISARTAPDRWRPIALVRNRAARARGGVAELEICTFRQHVPVGPRSGTTPPVRTPPPRIVLDEGRVSYQVLERSVRHDRVESPAHYPDDDLVDVARVVAWVEPVEGYRIRALPIEAHRGGEHGAAAASLPARVNGGATWLDNDALRVEITDHGHVRLYDRARGRVIPSLLRFEDVGDAGDLYTHSPIAPIVTAARFLGAEVRCAGPLRGELTAAWQLDVPASSDRAGRSLDLVPIVARCTLTLDANAPFLRVSVAGDNAARDHRLRVVLATGIERGDVFADAAFGVVRREPIVVSEQAAAVELPPPTAPMHRYVTIATERDGATVFSDGLAEYEATEAGDIAITLVRAVGELSRNDLPERPGHAGWPVSTPDAQCLGPFDGAFAIMPHGSRDVGTIDAIERAADDVLLPLTGTTLRSALAIPERVHGITLEGDALAFSTCKASEDGAWTVVRCVNLSDAATRGRWRFGF
ncbi:MAG TPA: glycoside hydrolase family 38 C-terminal domain-containing protein, partial [Gemmatimonadaceae bacterium]